MQTHQAEGVYNMRMQNPETRRATRLLRLFDLHPGDFERIETTQGGVCAICGRPPKDGMRLQVDHDHLTGLVRGLVCWRDNVALQGFHDDVERMRAAVEYLEHPPAVRALGAPRYGREGRVTNKVKKAKKTRAREKHGLELSPRGEAVYSP